MKKTYESWPAKNRFYFGGRLVCGPDRRYFYLAFSFMIVPFVIFCGFVWPYLFIRLHYYVALPLLIAWVCLWLASIAFMFITRYSDPGIIPRGIPFVYDPDNPWDYEKKKPAETIKINVCGETTRIKYCETCHIYRPPRAIHCAVCDNCVDRFDHHCPWIGNCVGRGNYQTFFIFVWTTILNAIFCICLSVVHLTLIIIHVVEDESGVDIFTYLLKYGGWFSGFMIGYCLLAIILIGFLGTFHCMLVCTSQTTNEKLKGLYKKRKNPYSKGPFTNLISILFAPKYQGYVDFTEEIEESERRKMRRKFWPQKKRKDTERRETVNREEKKPEKTKGEEEKAKAKEERRLLKEEKGDTRAPSKEQQKAEQKKKKKKKKKRKTGGTESRLQLKESSEGPSVVLENGKRAPLLDSEEEEEDEEEGAKANGHFEMEEMMENGQRKPKSKGKEVRRDVSESEVEEDDKEEDGEGEKKNGMENV